LRKLRVDLDAGRKRRENDDKYEHDPRGVSSRRSWEEVHAPV
jgi:hypothetical protein